MFLFRYCFLVANVFRHFGRKLFHVVIKLMLNERENEEKPARKSMNDMKHSRICTTNYTVNIFMPTWRKDNKCTRPPARTFLPVRNDRHPVLSLFLLLCAAIAFILATADN